MILLEPEFYDIFGIFVFSFLVYVSYHKLKKEKLPIIFWRILFGIGLLGFIVDSFFVSRKFF